MNQLYEEATDLLEQLIAAPSFSGQEKQTGDLIQQFLESKDIPVRRHFNNIWCANKHFDPGKPTILLNSHHDTVKPNSGYTRDPFSPAVEDGKLFGLGSNDAGGPLTSLIAAFVHFYPQEKLTYNLVLAATGEEEISGDNGLVSILEKIPEIDCAIVGEPTQMRMAVAEKGLMVLECTARGVSGHAARDEGENAIYTALRDIEWLRTYQFDKISDMLGPVKMTATVIEGGSQHNVVPDTCMFTVDVRSTDAHDNAEILNVIDQHMASEITARSIRLNPSFIPLDHPIVRSGDKLGLEQYGSPTLSDQSILPVPSLKIGPGKSARSHTPDEFIRLGEIKEGINIYITLLDAVITS
ncbi:MAG TPA: M20 family metallo-hydrolase [Fodinibius sp.]|nr:M20 family metallo-hydrolase [Fodinibius sp.]